MGDTVRLMCNANNNGLPNADLDEWHVLEIPAQQVRIAHDVGRATLFMAYVCPCHDMQQILTRKPLEIIRLTHPGLGLSYVEVNGKYQLDDESSVPATSDKCLNDAPEKQPEDRVIDLTSIIDSDCDPDRIVATAPIFSEIMLQPA